MKTTTVILFALTLAFTAPVAAKERSRFVTAQMRANLLANAEKFDWIKKQQDGAIQSAAASIALSDDELWAMVPSQDLPRAVYTTEGILYKGIKPHCPNCGEDAPVKLRTRSFWTDVSGQPWKLQCKNCKEIYPKNDFEAYYRSGIDSRGLFSREKANESLVFNAEHPDPNDPLHKLYVEDGLGMTDEKGQVHHMIGYYAFHYVWPRIERRMAALANAYVMTSKPIYAHKLAVLIDRIADVYPEMDYMPYFKIGMQHSHGGTGRGRIEGCIWETSTGRNYANWWDNIYDGIKDDKELVAFISAKANKHGLDDKSTFEKIVAHINKNLLQEILISCKDGRIAGNTGSTQSCLATAAIAMDDPELTRQWLDWLFDPGYPGEYTDRKDPINWVLVEGLDRDGMGGENGGYGLIWTNHMQALVNILQVYPEYTKHDLVRDYPKLKQSFFVKSRLNVLDGMMPNSGDSGGVGSWGRQGRAKEYVLAYKLYGDPRFADLAVRESNVYGSSMRLGNDKFSTDPDGLIKEIQKVGDPGFALESRHMGRYGQAYLQTTHKDNGRAVFIHYGQGKGHSHHDNLNIGILAKNVAMIPDLAYPEYTGSHPKRHAWTSNTISHNTLVVNDRKADYSPGGKLELFAVAPPLRVMQINSPHNYRKHGVKTYRRTVAMIDVGADDSYVFDVFRAEGGKIHRLSWHGHGESAAISIDMTKQASGTYAGEDVPFAKLDGPQRNYLQYSGHSYLYDVERSSGKVAEPYTVDWKLENGEGVTKRIAEGKEPHLRLHALTACDEVALATGDSPRKHLSPRYLLQSRFGEDVASQYVNVLEPYEKTPLIKQVRLLKDEPGAAAAAVQLADGRTDIVISSDQPRSIAFDNVTFDGMFALIRLQGDKVTHMRMVGGTKLTCGGAQLIAGDGVLRGKVTKIDASNAEDNRIYLDPPLPNVAEGLTIHFVNDDARDTSYQVTKVIPGGISTGDITIVRGFKNPKDFDAGVSYLVNPGNEYVLPMPASKDF